MEIGARVKYIHIDDELDKKSGFYPPIGTFGTVTEVDGDSIMVKWDNGTKGDGEWICGVNDVEEVGFNEGFETETEDWNENEVWEAIHELSDIRARYNLFDVNECGKHHACCLAIKALRNMIGE
jgi:hypothetical protein